MFRAIRLYLYPVLIHKNDLFYLKKGGRVSAVSAAFGTMLNIKPMIVFDTEGKLKVVEKNKGMKKAFFRVVEHINKAPMDELKLAVVVHTNNPQGAADLAALETLVTLVISLEASSEAALAPLHGVLAVPCAARTFPLRLR